MQPSSFTNSEFARLKEDLERLVKINANLKAELKVWKPEITVDAGFATNGQPEVVYTCRYSEDGYRHVFTANDLANAPAEVLEAMCNETARRSAEVRSKKIADMLRPFMQRAADYAQTAGKK